MGSARGNTRGRGGRGSRGSVNFDPLACYRCGVHGHLARDCPQPTQSQGSNNAGPSRGTFSQSGKKAQGDEVVVVGPASEVLIYSMMRTGPHILWMMQVSCTSLSTADMIPMMC